MNGADLLDRALTVAVVALACLLAFKVFADDGHAGGKVVTAIPGVERPWLPGERERVLGNPPVPGQPLPPLSRLDGEPEPPARLRWHLQPGEVIDCRVGEFAVHCRAVRGFWL